MSSVSERMMCRRDLRWKWQALHSAVMWALKVRFESMMTPRLVIWSESSTTVSDMWIEGVAGKVRMLVARRLLLRKIWETNVGPHAMISSTKQLIVYQHSQCLLAEYIFNKCYRGSVQKDSTFLVGFRSWTLRSMRMTVYRPRTKKLLRQWTDAKVMKKCPILRTMLHAIIVECCLNRCIPQCWKRSATILFHKKGDTSDPSNFRPITLQPVLYKILATILRKRMFAYLNKNYYYYYYEHFSAQVNTGTANALM